MSERDTEGSVSNRSLLYKAVESDMQNDLEREYLRKYKETMHQIESEQLKLSKIRTMLKELSSDFSTINTAKIESLKEAADDSATLIDVYDRYLLDLEATPTLQTILERENALLRKRFEQQSKESLASYRENAAKEAEEIIKRYREQRQEALKRLNEQEALSNREQVSETPKKEPKMVLSESNLKERLSNSLGNIGIILFYITRLIIAVLPFVMIGGNFFFTLLLITINTFVPFASVVFWIWGLVCAINGVQDFWAILYYISFIVIWIPFFISTIIAVCSKER